MAKTTACNLFCIQHGEMVDAVIGEISGQHLHLAIYGDPRNPDVDWCEGPFASCPPPEMTEEMWKAVFADEQSH